jgi:preprotein translocase subunit YajC
VYRVPAGVGTTSTAKRSMRPSAQRFILKTYNSHQCSTPTSRWRFWLIVVVPQRRARDNQVAVLRDLKTGDKIVTVGGIVGKLTYLNREEDIARVEIAKGVEVEIIPSAISHPYNYMDRLAALEARENAKSKKNANAR